MSGPKTNSHKSEFMMVLDDNEKGMLDADIFECQLSNRKFKYLGVPVCGSRLHYRLYDYSI
jgi:hypothetical protein